jgi:hypothetical protein
MEAFRALPDAPKIPLSATATLGAFAAPTVEGDASPLVLILKFLRNVHDTVNLMMRGKLNATLDISLRPGFTTTVIVDPRLSGSSYIGLACPLTANAAAELGAGGLWVSSQDKQTATLTHANNAQADRTFRILIIG